MPSPNEKNKTRLKKIDAATGAIRTVVDSDFVSKISLNTFKNLHGLDKSFLWLAFGLNILIFLSIPIRYLAARLQNQEIEFSRTKWILWAAAGIGLGLLLAVIFIPAAGPYLFIGFMGLATLTASYVLLNTFFNKRPAFKTKKALLAQEIEKLKQDIQSKTQELQNQHNGSLNVPINDKLSAQSIKILEDITQLGIALNQTEKTLETVDGKLNNLSKVIMRSIGLGITGLGLAGVCVALFIPPVGMLILLTSMVLGLITGITGLTMQLLHLKKQKAAAAKAAKNEPVPRLNSTTTLMKELYKENATNVIELLLAQDKRHTDLELN